MIDEKAVLQAAKTLYAIRTDFTGHWDKLPQASKDACLFDARETVEAYEAAKQQNTDDLRTAPLKNSGITATGNGESMGCEKSDSAAVRDD